jgi:hypothetical protein
MKQLVYLPSLYLLASLLMHRKLAASASKAWMGGELGLPAMIKRTYQESGFDNDLIRHPGIYPQWKSYCKPAACNSCFIFKKVIES